MIFSGIEVHDVREDFPYVAGREYEERKLSNISTVVFHHSVTGTPSGHAATMRTLQSIHEWHTAGKTDVGPHNWPAIGYHFAIDGRGEIYYLNNINLITYHARNANVWGIGVVWLGSYLDAAPTKVMQNAAGRLYSALCSHLNNRLQVLGHYQVTSATACPGPHWAKTRDYIWNWTPEYVISQQGAENWEKQAFRLIFVGASNVSMQEGSTADDAHDAEEILRHMDRIKERHNLGGDT